jgi:hypothetical protein
VRLLAFVALISGVLVAGCGGSPARPTTSLIRSVKTSPASTLRLISSNALSLAELAFAKCMRSSGVPNFPDPNAEGNFTIPAGTSPSAPAFQAAQTKCHMPLPVGVPASSGPPPSAHTLGKLLKIARCMRDHGVAQFPDPRASVPDNFNPGEYQEITNFDGAILLFPATINLQAPAYKQALTACGAPPLGLPH